MGNKIQCDPKAHVNIKQLIPANVAIYGDSDVGKTALITRYTQDTFIENDNEINNQQKDENTSVKSKIYPLKQFNINIQIHDQCSKNTSITSDVSSAIDAKVIIFAFDLMNKKSLLSIRKWYTQTRKLNKEFIPILVGNKYDLFENMNDLYKIEITKTAREFANKMHCPFIMTSAKSSIHIHQIFQLMIEYMFRMRFTLKQRKKERVEPILEWNAFGRNILKYTQDMKFKNMLHPTVHLKKLITINENGHIDNKDMIESDGSDNESMENDYDDIVYQHEYIYHSGANFDDDDVEEVKQFLNKTKKVIQNVIHKEGFDDDKENENDMEQQELKQGVTLMGMMTNDGNDDGNDDGDEEGMESVEIRKSETLMGFAEDIEWEKDDGKKDEGQEVEDVEIGMMKGKGITLMGDMNIGGKEDDESADEKIIGSGNITMIGMCDNEKLKFVKQ